MFPHSIVISTWLFINSTTDSAPKNLWDVHPNQKPFLHGVYKQECEPFHRKKFKKHVNPLGCLILGKQAYVAAYIIYINVSYIYIYIFALIIYSVYMSNGSTAKTISPRNCHVKSIWILLTSQSKTNLVHWQGNQKGGWRDSLCCTQTLPARKTRKFRLAWVLLREHRFIRDRPRWVVWSKSSINNVLLSLRKRLPANIPTRSNQVVFSTPWFQALTLMIGARYLPQHAQAWVIFQLEIGEHRRTFPNHLKKGLLLFGEAKSILGHWP